MSKMEKVNFEINLVSSDHTQLALLELWLHEKLGIESSKLFKVSKIHLAISSNDIVISGSYRGTISNDYTDLVNTIRYNFPNVITLSKEVWVTMHGSPYEIEGSLLAWYNKDKDARADINKSFTFTEEFSYLRPEGKYYNLIQELYLHDMICVHAFEEMNSSVKSEIDELKSLTRGHVSHYDGGIKRERYMVRYEVIEIKP
jgi:hypothetical protein